MSQLFDRICDAWVPIYAPESQIQEATNDSLPDGMMLDEERGTGSYQGKGFVKRKLEYEIPGAWGCGFTIKKDSRFRYPQAKDNSWYRCTSNQYLTFDSAAPTLEVISITDQDETDWVEYSFVEVD